MITVDKRLLILIGLLIILIGSTIIILLPSDPSTIDTDNDGIMNDKDEFPNDSSEWNDTDNDGVGDNQDKFPFDPAASMDSDDDGYPDKWNEGKDANDSTSNPPLIKDDLPFDPTEYQDSDGDGFGDNSDVFPYDPSEWKDSDGDGIGDNADQNPLVNLSLEIMIDKCLFSKHVDILPWAQIYFEFTVNGEETIIFDNNQNYWRMWKNQQTSVDVVFQYDIPDDTTRPFTDIEIKMFDYDLFLEDDLIDINETSGESSVVIRLNHATNEIQGTGVSEGEKGKIWYTITKGSEVEPTNITIDKTYEFRFNNKKYEVSLNIPNQKYMWYQNRLTNRSPQQLNNKQAMADFVTKNDVVITQLAEKLDSIALNEGFTEIQRLNFMLNFVQYVVDYQDDNSTAGCEEYWRYPIETLVEQRGDCEDSTLLFASIMENVDVDSVLLFYVLDDTNGHLATGIQSDENISGTVIDYKQKSYYYCETTSVGFAVGEKPSEIPDDPETIIPL